MAVYSVSETAPVARRLSSSCRRCATVPADFTVDRHADRRALLAPIGKVPVEFLRELRKPSVTESCGRCGGRCIGGRQLIIS